MATTFPYYDPVLDFDDVNVFLSTLLTTVPTLDRSQNPWDDPESALAFGGDSLYVDQMDLQNIPEQNYGVGNGFVPGFPENGIRLSISLTTYSELIGSNGSVEGTPFTNVSSSHALPNVKKEPFDYPLYSSALNKTSSEDTDNSEIISPKLRAAPKDKVSKPAKKTKVSHNMIEKKYRTNINSKILELRDAVPTLRIATGRTGVLVADLEGLTPASKLNKALVLTKATEYIKHLEHKNDAMRLQIAQLQELVRDANVNPRESLDNPTFQGGFGFNPTLSYNTTVNDYSMSSQNVQPSLHTAVRGPLAPNMGTNLMLGGLATVMGTSLLSSDNFRGMAAVPFFPSALAHPSPLTLQLLTIFRTGLVLFGVCLLLQPVLRLFRPSGKEQATNMWLAWLLVNVGLQLPKPVSAETKEKVLARLLGKEPFTFAELTKDYVVLSSSEVTFETSFLNVLVGSILVRKFPFTSRVVNVNLRLKGNLLMNLDYTGEDAYLRRISRLIKSLDGLDMFTSDGLMTRLTNLATGKTINCNINNGENHLTYIELYLHNKTDLYGILFNWRILELLHQLNMTYLDAISTETDTKEESIQEIEKDTKKLDDLLSEDSPALLTQYFTLFKCVLFPDSTPQLIQSLKSTIVESLDKVGAYLDGQELTDDEIISEDDESHHLTEDTDHQDPLERIEAQKSMVYSMNLMNEEKFIVLTSSLICYYMQHKDESKLRALLHHLKFKSRVPLSLLSFTCLVKVVCSLVNAGGEDEEDKEDAHVTESAVLESLIKLMRSWLNEDNKKNFMGHKFRSDLSDLVIAKGMTLNDI